MKYEVLGINIGKPNINGRVYTRETVENDIVNSPVVQEALKKDSLFLEYDGNLTERAEVDMLRICGRITKVYIEGDSLYIDVDKVKGLQFANTEITKVYAFGEGELNIVKNEDGETIQKVSKYHFYKFIGR